jgi:hypothetical protein
MGINHKSSSLYFWCHGLLALAGWLTVVSAAQGQSWEDIVTHAPPGPFGLPGEFDAVFEFGWSGVPAGRANVEFRRGDRNYEVRATGGTTGAARTLWRLDADVTAVGVVDDILPVELQQIETYRRHKLITRAVFSPEGVKRQRYRNTQAGEQPWKTFRYPDLRDLVASMLYVRSQPLAKGDQLAFLSFPGDGVYVVEIDCEGVEEVLWQGKTVSALRLNQRIRKLETQGPDKGKLLPHSRYRSGTIWLSNDKDRIAIRAEVRVFIGFVYGELKELRWRSPQK